MWMSKKVQCFIYMFILSAVPLILCVVVIIIVVLMWLLHFVCAAKMNIVQWLDFGGLKLYQGHKSIQDFPHNMGTALYQITVRTNGLKISKVVPQV